MTINFSVSGKCDLYYRHCFLVFFNEFEQTLGDGEGQVSLVFYNPQGYKQLDISE